MLHKSTKVIAISGAILCIVSVVAFVLFLRAVEVHKSSLTAQTAERAELEAHRVAISTLMRTLDETKAARESLFSRVLREEDVINFIALIESLGREQGVVLTTDALTVEQIDATFETLVIKVSVEGSYAGVMQVLKLTESLPYQAIITNVQFARSELEGGVGWTSSYSIRVAKLKNV